MKVLFVASEAHPLVKTGGLADVCGSLPAALQSLGVDVRLLLPGYQDALRQLGDTRLVARIAVPPLTHRIRLLEATLPGTDVTVWLVDFPPAFDRPGNPYLDARGRPWSDNAARFALLSRVAVAIAERRAGLAWKPDVVHCHDWQSGLVPALLSLEPERPATIFTIHNLAYQGRFPADTLGALALPYSFWSPEGLEFYGDLSFIKGGLVYADRITAVSPTYAREIQTPEFGEGLDGLLRHRAAHLVGILNGIDDAIWNPAHDPYLAAKFSASRLTGKRRNKAVLQEQFGLPIVPDAPLIGMVGRLAHQKGVDLFLAALPELMAQPVQFAILGSGDAAIQTALQNAAIRYRGHVAVHIGYDESTAHRIEAGADLFLMPSLFEPCGLNQLYSLRYGTVPVVRRVGGLADTVVDATPENLAAGTATGISFTDADPRALAAAVERGLALYRKPEVWKRLVTTGMGQDFSWRHSAAEYRRLYDELAAKPPKQKKKPAAPRARRGAKKR